jgi:hypothetical protein
MGHLSKRFFIAILTIAAVVVLLAGGMGQAAAGGGQVSIRFPAFSLSPGERVCGIKVKTSSGRLATGCRPNRWTCDYAGSTVHCYSLHPTYAVAITGMLPEVLVREIKTSADSLLIEASVEYIDGSGREYSREMRTSDMIIQ